MLRSLMFALAMLAATQSKANVLTNADLQGFVAFNERSLVVLRDLRDVVNSMGERASPEGFCLADLTQSLLETASELHSLAVLAALDTAMINRFDEDRVVAALRTEIAHFLSSLATQRRDINGNVGACSPSGAVATKAQDVLRLYDFAAGLVGTISRKIGANPAQ